jgi:putative PIN family toxin of toxin-antitoxin system
MTMNYLLDTCIIVSALRSKQGTSYQLLRQAVQGELPIVMDFKLLAEYRDVLMRPEMLQALVFEPAEIEMILARLVMVAKESRITFLWRPNLQDEGDNYLVEIAVAMQPCTLVTHNLKDFQQAELLFPHVRVKRPQQVLQERRNE